MGELELSDYNWTSPRFCAYREPLKMSEKMREGKEMFLIHFIHDSSLTEVVADQVTDNS